MFFVLLNCGYLISLFRERLFDYYVLRFYGFFGGKYNYNLIF